MKTDQPPRRNIEVIPAILPKSFDELQDKLEMVRGAAPWVQVDFVHSNFMQGHEAFPLWEEFDFECDIMLPNPMAEVEQLAGLGAERLIVHAHSTHAHEALELLQNQRGGEFPLKVGIALRAHDAPETLLPFDGLYDYVQVMGIDREGVQGEPFDIHQSALRLLGSLRALHPELVLQIDGGVTIENARALAQAGANRLVAGSAIFAADDPKAALRALYTEADAQ